MLPSLGIPPPLSCSATVRLTASTSTACRDATCTSVRHRVNWRLSADGAGDSPSRQASICRAHTQGRVEGAANEMHGAEVRNRHSGRGCRKPVFLQERMKHEAELAMGADQSPIHRLLPSLRVPLCTTKQQKHHSRKQDRCPQNKQHSVLAAARHLTFEEASSRASYTSTSSSTRMSVPGSLVTALAYPSR